MASLDLRHLAAHAIGFTIKKQDLDGPDETEIRFNYPMPVDKGETGLEFGFNGDLQGKEGAKAILVGESLMRSRDIREKVATLIE